MPDIRPKPISSSSSFHNSPVSSIFVNSYFKRLYKSSNRYHRFHAVNFKPRPSLLDVETNKSSPFFGFFTLFWMIVALLSIQSFCHSYAQTKTLFGFNIIKLLQQDLIKVGVIDLLMYFSTYFGLFLQLAVKNNHISWARSGWILQNIYQFFFLFFFLIIPRYFEFPWIARVFLLLHSLVLLMKQHSFAFFNGYLWGVKHQVEFIDAVLDSTNDSKNISKVSKLAASLSDTEKSSLKSFRDFLATELIMDKPDNVVFKDKLNSKTRIEHPADVPSDSTTTLDPANHKYLPNVSDPTTAPDSTHTSDSADSTDSPSRSSTLGSHHKHTPEITTIINTPTTVFPNNITFHSYFMFTMFPTLVYRHQYPRTNKIRWAYVAEKTIGTFGVLFLMIILAENHFYPIAISVLKLRDHSSWYDKSVEFPIILARLVPPFLLMFLLVFYIIWDAILNAIAELTRFADRSFYGPWWNCVTWDQFARDWNTPVHYFLLQHVYHSTISVFNVSKKTATLLTFVLSACVHELVMYIIFKKIRGYLLILQMMQLPLVALSRTEYLRDKQVLGNVVFWMGIITGPSLMCSLYLTF